MLESSMNQYEMHTTSIVSAVPERVSDQHLPYRRLLRVVGRPCILYTNSLRLQKVVTEFFHSSASPTGQSGPMLSIRLYVENAISRDRGSITARQAFVPHFRGFGPFVFATYGPKNRISFNLLDREVIGSLSSATVEDEDLCRRTILPVLVGVMSSSLAMVALHSACLVHGDFGVLLSGHSGVGKSTLSAALARKGLAFLSDDWTYLSEIEGHLHAWGMPVPIKLLPDSEQFFPELRKYPLTQSLNGEIAYEIDPEIALGWQRSLHCVPKCFLLLERSSTPGTKFERIGIDEIIPYVVDGLEELPEILTHLRVPQIDLVRKLENCELYRMRFHGSPDYVADEVLGFCQNLFQKEDSDDVSGRNCNEECA